MPDSQPSAAPAYSTRPLAYILDDEPQVLAIVGKILAALGFASQQFATPEAMFAVLGKASPELIVLDLALGQSDAVEVIRHLEILRYSGKVLLISGRDHGTLGEIQRIGERHGLTMLTPVQKPFRTADIKASLAAVPAAQNGQPDPQSPAAEHDVAEARVDPEEALRNSWLRLWCQAKIDLKTMTVRGAEGLLRAHHPELGIVAPKDFRPVSGKGQLSTDDQIHHPAGDGGLGEFREPGTAAQIGDQCAAVDPAVADLRRAHPRRAAEEAEFFGPDHRDHRRRHAARPLWDP
jgi:DNA-binding response OmpR family regulator